MTQMLAKQKRKTLRPQGHEGEGKHAHVRGGHTASQIVAQCHRWSCSVTDGLRVSQMVLQCHRSLREELTSLLVPPHKLSKQGIKGRGTILQPFLQCAIQRCPAPATSVTSVKIMHLHIVQTVDLAANGRAV